MLSWDKLSVKNPTLQGTRYSVFPRVQEPEEFMLTWTAIGFEVILYSIFIFIAVTRGSSKRGWHWKASDFFDRNKIIVSPNHHTKQAVDDSWAFLMVQPIWKVVETYCVVQAMLQPTESLKSAWGRSLDIYENTRQAHLVALGLCNALLWGWPLSKWRNHLFWNLRTHCLLVPSWTHSASIAY